MKKIAFLTYDWNNEVIGDFSKGIDTFLQYHEDVIVHFFDAFGNYGIENAEKGDFQVFNVPYLQDYDGMIIQGNRVWKPELRQMIADKAKDLGLPVVAINYPLFNCVNVTSDNTSAIHLICKHVIEEHHAKNLVFVRGPEVSAEAKEREESFAAACDEYGIVKYEIIDGGTWAIEEGEKAAEIIVNMDTMPDAVICANDDLACGVIQTLQAKGFKVPEDTIVTGFDHLDISEACDPQITTIDRDYKRIAINALDAVTRLIAGEQLPERIVSENRLVLGGSCGCGNRYDEFQSMKEKYFNLTNSVKHFYRSHDVIKHQLSHAETMIDVIKVVERNAREFGNEHLYMAINGDYLDNYERAGSVKEFSEKMYLMGIADGEEHYAGGSHIYDTFERREILPAKYLEDKQFVRIYPLRYDEIMIGYIVMDGKSTTMEYNFLEMLFSLVDSAMENVHRANVMDALNGRLADLYVKDQQTGLYNRFGLEKYGTDLYNRIMKEDKKIFISFIDIDRMKSINDLFGHDAGDKAIEMTADIIREAIGNSHSIAVRYGGDEFVVLGNSDISESLADAYLKLTNQIQLNFSYTISHGFYVARTHQFLTLQEAIDKADDKMYSIKKAKKNVF